MYEYTREKVIGEGTFGKVWLVKSPATQNLYVLKDISLYRMTESEKQRALTEVSILSKCRHNNIIRYKDSVINKEIGSLSILMEYADGGDLGTAIRRRKGCPFQENVVISWFTQICLALQYIHYSNILHRDLKCRNIFLTKNKVIKVGDFGIARVLRNSDDLATTNIGTPYYLSPEMCKQQPYNCKTDMWALGCILFEMSALEHPFESANFVQLVSSILKGRRRNLPTWSGPIVRELVDDLLQLDPTRRSSADEILGKPALEPFLTSCHTSKIPKLVDSENHSNTKVLSKEKTLKRSSETNSSPGANKIRSTSTGKLHIRLSSSTPYHSDITKSKTFGSSSRNIDKIPIISNIKEDTQCRGTLNNTYIVPKCVPSQVRFSSEVDIFLKSNVDNPLHRSKEAVSPCKMKMKESEFKKKLSNQKCEPKNMNKKIENNVDDENKLSSTYSSSNFLPQYPCNHSQCHQCMIDMLWKNRIRGCLKTTLNNEEYSELQMKLLCIFKKEKFNNVYQYFFNNWNEGDLQLSSKNYTKSLSYEQVQHLPLMIQLVQLDMLKKFLRKENVS